MNDFKLKPKDKLIVDNLKQEYKDKKINFNKLIEKILEFGYNCGVQEVSGYIEDACSATYEAGGSLGHQEGLSER